MITRPPLKAGVRETQANRMFISASRLSAALAPRLDAVVPRPFRLHAEGPVLVLEHPDGWGAQKYLDWIEHPHWLANAVKDVGAGRAIARVAEIAVVSVLDGLQHDIPEALREPWPALSPTRFAAAAALCDGENVYLWYGESEETAVVSFPPIPLSDLVAGAEASSRGNAAP